MEPTHTAVTLTFEQCVALGTLVTPAITEAFITPGLDSGEKTVALCAHEAVAEIIIALAETWPERHTTEQIVYAAQRKAGRDQVQA